MITLMAVYEDNKHAASMQLALVRHIQTANSAFIFILNLVGLSTITTM